MDIGEESLDSLLNLSEPQRKVKKLIHDLDKTNGKVLT